MHIWAVDYWFTIFDPFGVSLWCCNCSVDNISTKSLVYGGSIPAVIFLFGTFKILIFASRHAFRLILVGDLHIASGWICYMAHEVAMKCSVL